LAVASSNIRSTASLIEGAGGSMYVFLATYSLRMSFCVVPRSSCRLAPWLSATATYSERRIGAVALIVIDVLTRSRLIPSNRISMSFKEQIGTPTLPLTQSRGYEAKGEKRKECSIPIRVPCERICGRTELILYVISELCLSNACVDINTALRFSVQFS
jgi:hypothetical protein